MPRSKSESLEDFQKKNLEKHLQRVAMKQQKAAEDTEKTTKARQNYVNNEELLAELCKWRDSNPDPTKRVVSEELGEMILKIATRYMNHPNYIRYSQEIKEDIISMSCYRVIRALPNYSFEFTNPFAYFTQICFSSAMQYLKNHYKYLDNKRRVMRDTLLALSSDDSGIKISKMYLNFLQSVTGSDNLQDADISFIEQNGGSVDELETPPEETKSNE